MWRYPYTAENWMSKKNFQNIDTSIEVIRAIYLNSIADAIVNHTKNFDSKFKAQPDTLANRIAQEFVMDFLKTHQMDAAFKEASIESKDVIKQERTHKYIARKLNLDPKKPLFKQIRTEMDIKTYTETQDGENQKLPKPSISLSTQQNQPHNTYLKSQDMSEFTNLLESRAPTMTNESKSSHRHSKRDDKSKQPSEAPKSIASRSLKSKSSALSTREHYTGLTPTLTSLQTKTFIQPTQDTAPKEAIVTKTGENLYELFQFDGTHEIGPATRMMLELRAKMIERETAYERIPVADTTEISNEDMKTNTTLRSLHTKTKNSSAKSSAANTQDSSASKHSTKTATHESTKDSTKESTKESAKESLKSRTNTKSGNNTVDSKQDMKTSDAKPSESYEEEEDAGEEEENSLYVEVSNSH